jgi:hypothetical protein
MSDLIFGLTVSAVVAIVVLIVGTVTAIYCRRVERREVPVSATRRTTSAPFGRK